MTTTTLLVLARGAHFAGAMLLFALPFFAGWIMRPALAGAGPQDTAAYGPLGRTLMKWLWGALVIEALSGAAWFWLVAAQMSDVSPWSVPDSDALGAVLWQTQFGRLWMGRTVALAVLFVLTVFAPRGFFFFGKDRRRGGLMLAVSGALLVSLAWAGHAAAGINERNVHLVADTFHLLLGAIWPMGLVPFALFLRYADRIGRTQPMEMMVMQRFSQTSFMVVFALVATGLVNGWLLVGSWPGLFDTVYGRWLLVKVAVAGLMIALGAWNRYVRLPGLAVALEEGLRDTALRRGGLRRSVVTEAVLAGIVLLIVGVLGMTPPPQ